MKYSIKGSIPFQVEVEAATLTEARVKLFEKLRIKHVILPEEEALVWVDSWEALPGFASPRGEVFQIEIDDVPVRIWRGDGGKLFLEARKKGGSI